jgi:hypothetical protein
MVFFIIEKNLLSDYYLILALIMLIMLNKIFENILILTKISQWNFVIIIFFYIKNYNKLFNILIFY